MEHLVLVDYSWVLHKSFHAYSRLSANVDGMVVPTGTLYGFVVLMGQLKKTFPNAVLLFALDGGRGGREKVYEWYKDNRNHNPATYRLEKDIHTFLSYRNHAHLVKADGFEADDVIAVFARSNNAKKVTIFSADNDMFQLVDDSPDHHVQILRSMSKPEYIGVEACKAAYGVEPSKVLLYRSAIGDDSDCIPSIMPRLRKSLVAEVAGRYRTPDDILTESNWINDQHSAMAAEECLTAWKRNYDVMSFRHCSPQDVTLQNVSDADIVAMADKYQMKSMMKFVPVT